VTPSMRWVSRSGEGTSCLMIVRVTGSPPACSPHSRAMRLASATVSVATVIVLFFHVCLKQTWIAMALVIAVLLGLVLCPSSPYTPVTHAVSLDASAAAPTRIPTGSVPQDEARREAHVSEHRCLWGACQHSRIPS